MLNKTRLIMHVFIAMLPIRIKRSAYRHLFGWEIDDTARIGFSIMNVRDVYLGPNTRIGHFSVFMNLQRLHLANNSRIGQWNWCSAAPLFSSSGQNEAATLVLGEHAAITIRHYLDCSGGISIGAFSVFGGVKSTVLTHQVDTVESRQTTSPVQIGEYCFIGSDVRITSGSQIPDRCIVAMGAVVAGQLAEEGMLYGGVPAKPIKPVEGEFFKRSVGFVR